MLKYISMSFQYQVEHDLRYQSIFSVLNFFQIVRKDLSWVRNTSVLLVQISRLEIDDPHGGRSFYILWKCCSYWPCQYLALDGFKGLEILVWAFNYQDLAETLSNLYSDMSISSRTCTYVSRICLNKILPRLDLDQLTTLQSSKEIPSSINGSLNTTRWFSRGGSTRKNKQITWLCNNLNELYAY